MTQTPDDEPAQRLTALARIASVPARSNIDGAETWTEVCDTTDAVAAMTRLEESDEKCRRIISPPPRSTTLDISQACSMWSAT
jgi:hypothetical protein